MVVKTGQDLGKPPKPPKKLFGGLASRILRGKSPKDEDSSSLSNYPDDSERHSSSRGLSFAEERQDEDDARRGEEPSNAASHTSKSNSQSRRQQLRSNKKAFKDPEVRAEVTKLYNLIHQVSHNDANGTTDGKLPVRKPGKASKFDEMLEKYGDYLVDESGGKITRNPRVMKCPLVEKSGHSTTEQKPQVENTFLADHSWFTWYIQSSTLRDSAPTRTASRNDGEEHERSIDENAVRAVSGLLTSPSSTANQPSLEYRSETGKQVDKEFQVETTAGFVDSVNAANVSLVSPRSAEDDTSTLENTTFLAKILGCIGDAFQHSLSSPELETPVTSAQVEVEQLQGQLKLIEEGEAVGEDQNIECESTTVAIVESNVCHSVKPVTDDVSSQCKVAPSESAVVLPNEFAVTPTGRARTGSLGSLFRFRRSKRKSKSRTNSREGKTDKLVGAKKLDKIAAPRYLAKREESSEVKCKIDSSNSDQQTNSGEEKPSLVERQKNDSQNNDVHKNNEDCVASSEKLTGKTLSSHSTDQNLRHEKSSATVDTSTQPATGESINNTLSRCPSIKIALSTESRASNASKNSRVSKNSIQNESLLSQLNTTTDKADSTGCPHGVSPTVAGEAPSNTVHTTSQERNPASPSNDAEQSYLLGYLLAQLTFQGETDKRGKAGSQDKDVTLPETKSQKHIPMPKEGTSLSDILRQLQAHHSPRLARGYLAYILAEFARHACSVDRAALQKGYVERLYQRPPAIAADSDRIGEVRRPSSHGKDTTTDCHDPINANPPTDQPLAANAVSMGDAVVSRAKSCSSTRSGLSKVSRADTASSEKIEEGDKSKLSLEAAPTHGMDLGSSKSSGIETPGPASYSLFGRGCSCFGGVQQVDSEELDTLTTAVENSIATLRDDERDEDRDDSSSGSSIDHSEHDEAEGALAFSDIESWFDFLEGHETYDSSSEDEEENDVESTEGESSKELDPPPSFDVSEWMLQK